MFYNHLTRIGLFRVFFLTRAGPFTSRIYPPIAYRGFMDPWQQYRWLDTRPVLRSIKHVEILGSRQPAFGHSQSSSEEACCHGRFYRKRKLPEWYYSCPVRQSTEPHGALVTFQRFHWHYQRCVLRPIGRVVGGVLYRLRHHPTRQSSTLRQLSLLYALLRS